MRIMKIINNDPFSIIIVIYIWNFYKFPNWLYLIIFIAQKRERSLDQKMASTAAAVMAILPPCAGSAFLNPQRTDGADSLVLVPNRRNPISTSKASPLCARFWSKRFLSVIPKIKAQSSPGADNFFFPFFTMTKVASFLWLLAAEYIPQAEFYKIEAILRWTFPYGLLSKELSFGFWWDIEFSLISFLSSVKKFWFLWSLNCSPGRGEFPMYLRWDNNDSCCSYSYIVAKVPIS